MNSEIRLLDERWRDTAKSDHKRPMAVCQLKGLAAN